MQAYDIERLAVAARSVADECKANGFENVAAQIMPLRKIKYGQYEGAIIARIPIDGEYKMIACGWSQDAKEFTWAARPE